jgi:hypothetical protein
VAVRNIGKNLLNEPNRPNFVRTHP